MHAQLRKRVSSTTVATAKVLFNGALKKAVKLHLIPSNPMDGTESVRPNKPQHYALTVAEALKLVAACEDSRLGLAFIFALKTGLRPEELTGLQWPCLDLRERGVIRVERVVNFLSGGGWRWHEPKTKKGRRSIVFPGELVTRLLEHRKGQLEQKMRVGEHWKVNDLVFCSLRGQPYRSCALEKEFKLILKRAGLPSEIRVYDLRHSFVTFSLLAGVDPKTVSYEAGHASVAFTLDTYGHVLEEMRESASDKREQLFRERSRG